MVKGASARENCPTDIKLALLEGPKHFEAFVKSLKGKYSRGTINKYLGELFKDGLVTRQGRRGPYELTPKGKKEAEREALKKKANTQIDNLGPKDIEFYKKKLDNLEKELKHYKRLNRIKELEELDVLPLQAVLKKLEQMGFNSEELCPDFYVEKTKNGERGHYGSRSKIINFAGGTFFDDFKPEDIEIKLIPASAFTEQIGDYYRKLSKELDQPINIPCRISQLSTIPFHDWEKYVPPESLDAWILLTDEPVKSYYIIGAYKELLQLYEEQFNEGWLEWKENFELSDEDWEEVGLGIREIMIWDAGRVDLDGVIADRIVRYIAATKNDAFERLKKAFMKQGVSLEEAEKWAREAVEEAEPAKIKIQQFNELWLKWKSECNALTKEDFASLFRLYQNIYHESSFDEQLESFYQWLKKHEKEQINPTYLNAELKNKLQTRLQDSVKTLKKLKHPKPI